MEKSSNEKRLLSMLIDTVFDGKYCVDKDKALSDNMITCTGLNIKHEIERMKSELYFSKRIIILLLVVNILENIVWMLK